MWVWWAAAWWWALAAADGDHPLFSVSVHQMRVQYDEDYVLLLNNTVEYILDFSPPPAGEEEGGAWPAALRVHSSGGDTAQPVLLTARQRAGAITWQLPYESGGSTKYELQRTLCPDDTAIFDGETICEEGAGEARVRGAFSLHVSSSCAAPLSVSVRARRPPHWRLPFASAVTLDASQTSPQVAHYAFAEGQHSVRLVVESEDDICATISVQNYSCPIAQTLADVGSVGLRMTVQYSGAVQISRRAFPRGFLVVAVVHGSRAACGGDDGDTDGDAQDWLWAEAVLGERHAAAARPLDQQPRKTFIFTVEAALSRGQYAAAVSVTAALFLLFYLAFVALVAAQRWPPFARLVGPKAVLAEPATPGSPAASASPASPASPVTNDSIEAESARAPRRRRTSVDTFDSSDGSSSEEEEQRAAAAPAAQPEGAHEAATHPHTNGLPAPDHSGGGQGGAQAGGAGAFGLPAQLRLAALARRRERTLRARSDRYLYTLATVAVFYALPVVQFVAVVQMVLNVSGSLDICYYNFLCAHPAGALSDFNHVLSNLGYLLLGALFLLQVRRRRNRRRRHPRHQEYGIPAHYGLLSALGAGMMVVAVLSASYHVCPNRLNFQFDTAFMYVLAVLSMVKIYQSRHPDVNARAHSTFGVLAVLIAIVVWGVLGGGPLFWGIWTLLHVFTFLLLSLRIYYVGQFRLEKESLQEAARELRRPMYRARLVMLMLANVINWMFAIYGLLVQSGDFAGHMLQVLLGNTLLYMVVYLALKLVQGERLRWYAWGWLAGAAAAWAPALYFFVAGSSDWSTAPALSRHRNHQCMVMQFYDSHDLWHILSAVALYFSFNAMLTWDDGLSAVKKTDIPVF